MEHNLKFRLTSILMVVCLLFTMMPVGVYALNVKDRENTLESKYDVDIEKEHIIEKDECTTTYSLGKGQKKKVFHGGIVRYKEENGELTDYDPSLVELSSDEKNKVNAALQKLIVLNKKAYKEMEKI